MILANHADNYNSTYLTEYGQMELENAFIDLNNFMTDLVAELEIRNIVTEDVTVRDINKGTKKATNLKDRIKRIIGNIIKFIKKIINLFLDKVEDLMSNNDAWITENEHKLTAITNDFWNACEITSYPYNFDNSQWGGSNKFTEDVYAQVVEVNTNSKVSKLLNSGWESDDDFYNVVAKTIHKINAEDFTAGCKTYYRGSTSLEAYNGTAAKRFCYHAIKYAKSYKNLANKLTSDLNKYKGMVETWERNSNKLVQQNGAVESFKFIMDIFDEPGFYSVIEERMVPYADLEVVQEIDATSLVPDTKLGQSATRSKTNVDAVKNAGKSGTVTMDEKPNGEPNTKNEPSNPSKSNTNSKLFTNHSKYFNTVLQAYTARMTIAEEAYHSYMRTVKTIVRTAQNRDEIDFKLAQQREKGLAGRAADTVKKAGRAIIGDKATK